MPNRIDTIRCFFLICFSIFLLPQAFGFGKNIAFYYGNHPAIDALHSYDIVIVQPDHGINPKTFNTKHTQAYAYVSIGEANAQQSYFQAMAKSWFIAKNTVWKSHVIDQSNPHWQAFFIKQIITPLWQRGYRGFFLDTMDSYQLASLSQKAQREQIAGLVQLIKNIKKRYPHSHLILNRGFEVISQVHQYIDAMAVESLYASWDQQKKRYHPVSKKERDWLLPKLKKVRALNIPIIGIDYLPPSATQQAAQVKTKIQALGYQPWVTNGDLTELGGSQLQLMPRKVLILYDSKASEGVMENSVLSALVLPLEYFGYAPVLRDLHQPLPKNNLRGIVQGIVVWTDTNYPKLNKTLQPFLIKQIKQHIPVVFMGDFGFERTPQLIQPFGLKTQIIKKISGKILRSQSTPTLDHQPFIGYEIKPWPNPRTFVPLQITQGKILLQFKTKQGAVSDAVAFTPWGGYALAPFTIMGLPNGHRRWVINPFVFLKHALRLPEMPIPDATTENGRRLMLVHVDGDGFVSRVEWEEQMFAGESLLKNILERYRVPTTVSIIRGEIASNGLYPQYTKEAEPIAREIFRLPWVEIANHSYSHPFSWQVLAKKKQGKNLNLPLPNYRYDPLVEITQSDAYINQRLAPAGKRSKIFLWTGDTDPDETAVGITYHDGIANMNGGDTTITNNNRSLTRIAPMGVYKGKYFQIFAPMQNENIYTNDWTGPFYGYTRVIETFKLTDEPRRFKPINIYYHFYSATKKAALTALHKVYQWSLKQQVFNLYASEYTQKILDFRHISLAKQQDAWILRTQGHLRELRTPKTMGYPDLQRSKNIVGFSSHGKDFYIHLGPATQSILYFTKTRPKIPYLVQANARIIHFKRFDTGLFMELSGHMPLEFQLANMQSCQVYQGKYKLPRTTLKNGHVDFQLSGVSDAFTIQCTHS